jgi:hypothetical protein
MTTEHDNPSRGPKGLSRRRVLRTGAVASVGALGASGLLLRAPEAAAHGSLWPFNHIWNVPTHYQNLADGSVTGQMTFQYQPNLYNKLTEWFQFYYWNTPQTFQLPGQILLNGTHVDKPGMHQYGRAADISGINLWHGAYQFTFDAFNGRYDWWRNNGQMVEYRRRYWAVVAGMNIYFKWVIHYHHDSEHHSHVHVDNEASDGIYSTFSTSSKSQVRMVQAVCNYIYGMGTSIDGGWGTQTDSHSRTVLGWTGWGGGIRDSQAHWHRFCRAGQRSGHNLPIDSGSMGVAVASGKPLPAQ